MDMYNLPPIYSTGFRLQYYIIQKYHSPSYKSTAFITDIHYKAYLYYGYIKQHDNKQHYQCIIVCTTRALHQRKS